MFAGSSLVRGTTNGRKDQVQRRTLAAQRRLPGATRRPANGLGRRVRAGTRMERQWPDAGIQMSDRLRMARFVRPRREKNNECRDRQTRMSSHRRDKSLSSLKQIVGGHARNRTGVRRFAVCCVTTPPRGLDERRCMYHGRFLRGNGVPQICEVDNLRRLAAGSDDRRPWPSRQRLSKVHRRAGLSLRALRSQIVNIGKFWAPFSQ
jgi:hypothetical protein